MKDIYFIFRREFYLVFRKGDKTKCDKLSYSA